MDKNHQRFTDSSNFELGDNEIRIVMPDKENTRRLYEASKIGSIETLNTLIQDDPNILHQVLVSPSYIESPLHISVYCGHLEFTRFLLDQKPELAVEVDSLQQTPLHLASANGEIEIVRALLEKNTSVCLVRDSNGLIPLHYAVIKGQIEIMEELINARPQSVWTKLGNIGQTVLHLCVKNNQLEALKLLIGILLLIDGQEFLNTTDDCGNTILDLSLMLRQFEMVRYLLSIPRIKTGTNCTMADQFSTSDDAIKRSSYKKLSQSSPAKTKKKGIWQGLKKLTKCNEDWLQQVQGTMMLVATVIATVTLQGTINPPGGVWQQDTPYSSINSNAQKFYKGDNHTIFQAGTSIMASKRYSAYRVYIRSNIISFLASASVILLIVSRFPLRNRICGGVLMLTMSVAVGCLAIGFLIGHWMVNLHTDSDDYDKFTAFWIAVNMWFGMLGVVVLCYVIRFLIMGLKKTKRLFFAH